MVRLLKILFLLLVLLAESAYAVTCTSVANKQTDWNKNAAWDAACGGTPPAGATVIIAAGTSILVDANVLANMAAGSITIDAGGTLTVKGGQTLSLSGNFTNNGTFTASAGSTIALTGTSQTISGNVSFGNLTVNASTQLTLTGNIVVNGTTNLSQANIVSTCPANYTVTDANNAVLAQSCAGGGGGGGNANCVPMSVNGVPSPLIAGVNGLTLGNNVAVNGTPVTIVGTSSLPVTGTTSAANAGTLPALSPATFPATGNGTTNAKGTVAAGSYGTVNANGNPTVFSGGTYYINTLNANGSIELAAGTYYINTLNLSGNLTVTGPVQIYIGTSFSINNQNATLNAGAGTSAANLRVNLYGGAQFTTNGNDRISFTGLIYSPFANSTVSFSGDTYAITGAIVTAGTVQVGRSSTITFDAAVQAQLASVACSNGPDHILITHTGSALTCSPQTVTLTACANAACTSNYTGTVTGTLSPGGAAFTINNGTATAAVQQTIAGTATLGATAINPAPTAAAPVTCLDASNNTASCNMIFSTAGFVITAPNHVACNDATVTIEAMQAGTNNRCVPAYARMTRAVSLSMSYANPASGTKSVTDLTNNSTIGTTATAHSLAFDANGKATLVIGYPDVGQVTLMASDTAPTGAAMSGSGSFIAVPASLNFAAVPPVTAKIKAGNPFDATVTATTGTGTACPAAVAAPNFGHETSPQLALGRNLVTGTYPGALSVSSFTAVTGGNGGVTATQSWDEAGMIKLTASLPGNSYLGVPATAMVTSTNLTFIPDHFDTAVLQTGTAPAVVPMNCPAGLTCPASYNGMVYSGQPFRVQVTAHNLAGGTTQNYQGAVARTVMLDAWNAQGGTAPNPGGGALSGNVVSSASFSMGAATTTAPAYIFATVPTAPTNVYIRATDADNVTSLRPAGASVEGGVMVASGRISLANAHGSELLPLPMQAIVQYWNGGNYVTSATDNSSLAGFADGSVTYSNCQKLASTSTWPAACPPSSSPVAVTLSSVRFVNGVLDFSLGAPGAQKTGSVDMAISAPGYLPGNPALATFGVYKNSNRFIYLRETY